MEQKIVEIIDKLAEKLGVASEAIWSVLVKQAFVEGITSIFWAIIMYLSAFVFYIFVRNLFKEYSEAQKNNPNEDYEGYVIAVIISGAMEIICLLVGLIQTVDAIHCLINPEYWALREILNQF